MKSLYSIALVCIATLLFSTSLFSQTFTMGKKCRASLATAQNSLTEKQYAEALDYFNAFASDCKTKDAKEAAASGKAEALNGLGRYEDAITEADKALKITKDRSLNAHFQKAIALNKLGRVEESKTELDQVLKLTENNENVSERASNYALMSALYERQMGDLNSAQDYLNEAKKLEPNNVEYLIQEGTMYASHGDYDRALQSYDTAVSLDGNSQDLYVARSNTRLKKMDAKYGSVKAQELRDKMTDEEKSLLCADMKRAQELGWKEMSKDMFVALVCN
jgi:tetratricopeptide (TPR) repeat protein